MFNLVSSNITIIGLTFSKNANLEELRIKVLLIVATNSFLFFFEVRSTSLI